jgi:hypothetical protein
LLSGLLRECGRGQQRGGGQREVFHRIANMLRGNRGWIVEFIDTITRT